MYIKDCFSLIKRILELGKIRYFGEQISVNVCDFVGGLYLLVGKVLQKTPFKTWTFIRTLHLEIRSVMCIGAEEN